MKMKETLGINDERPVADKKGAEIEDRQELNDGSNHYFKLVSDLDINLKPFIRMPIYDDAPHIGTFCSTLGVPHPQRGDYLIYCDGDIDFVSNERDFDEVSFTHKVNIETLLRKGIVREVFGEIFRLDMDLSCKIRELYVTKYTVETGIEDMREDKETFSEQDIKKCENDLENIKKQLADVIKEYEKVTGVM